VPLRRTSLDNSSLHQESPHRSVVPPTLSLTSATLLAYRVPSPEVIENNRR
jgi:hypothetical protein